MPGLSSSFSVSNVKLLELFEYVAAAKDSQKRIGLCNSFLAIGKRPTCWAASGHIWSHNTTFLDKVIQLAEESDHPNRSLLYYTLLHPLFLLFLPSSLSLEPRGR